MLTKNETDTTRAAPHLDHGASQLRVVLLLHSEPRRSGGVDSCPHRAADQACSRHGGMVAPQEAGDVSQEPSGRHLLEQERDLRGGMEMVPMVQTEQTADRADRSDRADLGEDLLYHTHALEGRHPRSDFRSGLPCSRTHLGRPRGARLLHGSGRR